MIQIRFIMSILFLLSQLTLNGQDRFPQNNISLIPSFYGHRFRDSLGATYNTKYMAIIRIALERKLYKGIYVNFTPNFSFVTRNSVKNGHGFGYELGVRKFWNIEIYNKKCNPVFRDRFLLSSKITFINNSYYSDRSINTFIYNSRLIDYGVNLFPFCFDLKIYKKIYCTYQYNILMAKYSNLKNHNMGLSILFN